MRALWNRLLDRLFGPRDYVVVRDEGVYFACHRGRVIESDEIVAENLRHGRAVIEARRRNWLAEDTPEPLL